MNGPTLPGTAHDRHERSLEPGSNEAATGLMEAVVVDVEHARDTFAIAPEMTKAT